MMYKFFDSEKINNIDELKKEYKTLARKHHPDMGGTDEAMKRINNEFDDLFTIFQNARENSTETAETFRSEFYTMNGWKGSKYDAYKYATVTEIAKAIRKDLKEAMPECKFSVTSAKASMCSEIHVALMEAPYRAYLTIEEVEEASKTDEAWKYDHFTQKKIQLSTGLCSYHNNYDKANDSRTTTEEKTEWLEQAKPTSKEITEILKKADAIVKAYRFDDSDGMIDYFDTNFYYFNCQLGSWDKDYICNPERANKAKKTSKVEATRKQQTEETTAITIEDKEIEITVADDVDTRDNSEITVVKVVTTLDKEVFKEVKAFMTSKGGYYSRFKHGFIFKDNTALIECTKPDSTEDVQNEPQGIEISSDETITETEETTGEETQQQDTEKFFKIQRFMFEEYLQVGCDHTKCKIVEVAYATAKNEEEIVEKFSDKFFVLRVEETTEEEYKNNATPQQEIEIEISFEDDGKLTEEQKQQIKQEIQETITKQSISFNDLTCVHTSWDYKLSCGIWVENIEWDNNLSVVACSVYG